MSNIDQETILADEFVSTRKPISSVKESRVAPKGEGEILNSKDRKKMLELEQQQKTLMQVYRGEKKYPVRVSPSYAKYFGRVMRVSINGIIVSVPCNGTDVQLPESFAAEVMRRIKEADALELKGKQLSQADKNFDGNMPGNLTFFN